MAERDRSRRSESSDRERRVDSRDGSRRRTKPEPTKPQERRYSPPPRGNFVLAVIIGFVVIALAILDSSYRDGLRHTHDTRSGCVRNSQNVASIVNLNRPRHNTASQLRQLDVLDSHIDSTQWHLLIHKRDRAAVRYGSHGHPAFSCKRAYTNPSFFTL